MARIDNLTGEPAARKATPAKNDALAAGVETRLAPGQRWKNDIVNNTLHACVDKAVEALR